jgi:hypothetical protein
MDADRLRNYHKLRREMQRDATRAAGSPQAARRAPSGGSERGGSYHAVADRQREVAMWKARGKAAAARMRAKRGE